MRRSCYIYCRCGSDNEFAKLACENQKEKLIQYANGHDLSVVEIGMAFEPGLSKNRQSIRDMISHVKNRHIDVVLVNKFSCLSRNMDGLYEIAKELNEAGAKISSLTEGELKFPTCVAMYCRVATQEQIVEENI